MKKITITIQDDSLIFKYRTNKPVNQELLNTNVIKNNEVVFSDNYLKDNSNIVGLFLSDLYKLRDFKEIIVSNNELALLVLNIIFAIPNIECFTINDDDNLSYELCEAIIKAQNIRKLNCYGVPEFMIELLDHNGIKVESRNEILFTSNFIAENNLNSFSKMFYKANIRFSEILTDNDFEDFKYFCNINKYLKTIHIDKYSFLNVKKITDILKKFKKKNISIQIHDDLDNPDEITNLKKLNKELRSKKIKMSLVYSKDYLEKNYLHQVIFATLRICAFVIVCIISGVIGYIAVNNVQSELKVKKISSEIQELLDEDSSEEEGQTTDAEQKMDEIRKSGSVSYKKLEDVNTDVVGWIKVKDTSVDYPVVQTVNNSYYLKHNFYRQVDFNGWIFMDYRNDSNLADDNTIIFGHNRFTSNVMFGTLQKLRKKSWFDKDSERQYITYNTLTEAHKWKIFSVYSIKVTADYMTTKFYSAEDKINFINMIKNRSEINFNTDVTENDKIITLSTCLDNDRRLVVHAVLLE